MLDLIYILFFLGDKVYKVDLNDVQCLAINIYHEARGESLEGQIAVSNVVLNRVKDNRFPNSICKVVKQAKYNLNNYMPLINKCHFSWYCDGKSDNPKNKISFLKSYIVSYLILMKSFKDNTNGATHYYNPSKANPKWAKIYEHKTIYDNHIFLTK